jgi:hypothetical protein
MKLFRSVERKGREREYKGNIKGKQRENKGKINGK